MSLLTDTIRQKVAGEVISDLAAQTLAWLIADQLKPDAGLDDIDQAIGQARQGFSPLFLKVEPKPEPEAEAPKMTGMRAAPSRDRSAERIRAATTGGNPWAVGSISRTRQAMVEAADPDLAARLRTEAGH